MIQKAILAATLALAATAASADVRFYTEYKHDLNFVDEEYVDDSARNNLRFGAQGEVFYLEVGPTERAGNFGTSYEAGYKYRPTTQWEFKGKLEGYQYDSFEGDIGSKLETEVRYYFN